AAILRLGRRARAAATEADRLRPALHAGPLLLFHALTLELVDGEVCRGPEAGGGCVPADAAAVDEQGDVDDVAVGNLVVALQPELHVRLAALVDDALQALELAFDVDVVLLRDGEVPASDRGT